MTRNEILRNRKAITEALRAPMPQRFKWNFDVSLRDEPCGSVGCAMGLMKVMGLALEANYLDCEIALGLDNGHNIFYPDSDVKSFEVEDRIKTRDICTPNSPYPGVEFSKVTPQMVADALEVAFERNPI